jgi:hypothetical protein
MTTAIESRTPAEAAGEARPQAMGRRWSDGLDLSVQTDPNGPWSMAQQWPTLVATLSETAVESSNLVLRALDFLVGAGRLRRAEAKALSDAMFQVRDTSLRAQQITRLAGGRIRQAKDRVDLADVIRHVLDERRDDFAARGAQVTGALEPADVLLDPPAAVSLVNAAIDWALSFSREITLCLETPQWPQPARLVARVATPRPAAAADGAPRPRGRRLNDGLHWMLLRQMAASASLKVTRTGEPGTAVVTVEFPNTFQNSDGLSSMDLLDTGHAAAALRDGWVLVVSRDTGLLNGCIDALRSVGITGRPAADFDAARRMVAESRPSAVVVAYDVDTTQLASFRHDALGGDGRCPLVEITRESPSFHINGFEGYETAKVGRGDVDKELAPAVLFELVKLG